MVEAGKELTVRRTFNIWSKRRWLPLAMIAVGVLLIGAVGGYYLYATLARSQLGELEYTVSLDMLAQTDSYASLYPGNLLPSLYWDDPRWADVDYDAHTAQYEGFLPLDSNTGSVEVGTLSAPTRIEIPGIDLASTVKELAILNYGDARGWETPKDVVGHIPTTANPGEAGKGYLFGHLQSPVRGEGSVFRNLTLIPDLLRKGQEVFIILYNEEDTGYLYQVSQITIIPQEEFFLQTTSESTITLVACVPAYVYDHRLLVTAKLVGVKEG